MPVDYLPTWFWHISTTMVKCVARRFMYFFLNIDYRVSKHWSLLLEIVVECMRVPKHVDGKIFTKKLVVPSWKLITAFDPYMELICDIFYPHARIQPHPRAVLADEFQWSMTWIDLMPKSDKRHTTLISPSASEINITALAKAPLKKNSRNFTSARSSVSKEGAVLPPIGSLNALPSGLKAASGYYQEIRRRSTKMAQSFVWGDQLQRGSTDDLLEKTASTDMLHLSKNKNNP